MELKKKTRRNEALHTKGIHVFKVERRKIPQTELFHSCAGGEQFSPTMANVYGIFL